MADSQDRPQNLRAQTMGSASDAMADFKRMSFSMNSKNVVGREQVKPELLCALCQAILMDPWECKECKNRFHQICLNKFAKETGQCPMMCSKPRFISVKKEVEKQLLGMQFVCNNQSLGCQKVLTYEEVREHDSLCKYTPIKCEAFAKCKTKCVRKDIEKHQAVCPNVLVPCIYCRIKVERMNIMSHESENCSGTYTCGKCGMTIIKEETQRSSHNCFNALAGYLQNMLSSKDYVIKVFKEEIGRKNELIQQLYERQEMLEQKLIRMEQVLSYDKPLPPESVQAIQQIKEEEPIENKEVSEYVSKLISQAQQTQEEIVEERKA